MCAKFIKFLSTIIDVFNEINSKKYIIIYIMGGRFFPVCGSELSIKLRFI